MRSAAAKPLLPLFLAAIALVLAGCSNPDAPQESQGATTSTSPQNVGEPHVPPAASPADQAPADVQRTPIEALEAFADLYINWTYRTLTQDQQTLAARSVGAARLAEKQAAASTHGDTTIARGRIFNSGQVISIAPQRSRPGTWVIVTREQSGGDSEYEGLPPAYHVTLAQLARVPGGYAVQQWLPQD